MNAQLIPPMTLDVDALLPPLPKPKSLWPDFPPWLADNGERILWRRLWTDAASSGERSRRPSESEVEAFPRLVELLRQASDADKRMTRASFANDGAAYLLAEAEFFKAHDQLFLLVKTVGFPAKFLTNIINQRVRTFPTKHRKPTESYEEFTARYNNTIAAYKAAGLPVPWAEDM